jgi:uncharacterized membrane protein HdeD (DUF308 family)
MALLDWILVVIGVVIGFAGSWIQLHPERVVPSQMRAGSTQNWPLDSSALSQIRLLGGCFLFMGIFFALQMTIDLTQLPWWIGTISGLVMAIASVMLVRMRVRGQQHKRRRVVMQTRLPEKMLELRAPLR